MRANPMYGYAEGHSFTEALNALKVGGKKDGHPAKGHMRVIDLDILDEAVAVYETLYGPASEAKVAALALDKAFRSVSLTELVSVRGETPGGAFLLAVEERPERDDD